MASEDHRALQDALGDGSAHFAAHIVAFQACDNTVFYVFKDRLMDIEYGTCIHI